MGPNYFEKYYNPVFFRNVTILLWSKIIPFRSLEYKITTHSGNINSPTFAETLNP